MSAYFLIRHRDLFIQVRYQAGKPCAEIVTRERATTFLSEADAWTAVHQHKLDEFSVENALNPQPIAA